MNELLDLVLQAHGGLERGHEVQSLDVRVSLTGGLVSAEGLPGGCAQRPDHLGLTALGLESRRFWSYDKFPYF
jgi:hypothetical protein